MTLPDQSAAPSGPPVVVKKYANRRLYNTESSSYITLDNLADMVRLGRDFTVCDAKTGEDITRSVLTQIIVEEENKVGRAMLPISFLRQLIGFYGDSLQGVVPRYLEQSMSNFARQQQQMRVAVQNTMGSFLPPGFEEMGRQNMAMLERAMTLFSPFYRADGAESDAAAGHDAPAPTDAPDPSAHPATPAAAHPASHKDEQIAVLKNELDQLRQELLAARTAQSIASGAVSAPAVAAKPRKG